MPSMSTLSGCVSNGAAVARSSPWGRRASFLVEQGRFLARSDSKVEASKSEQKVCCDCKITLIEEKWCTITRFQKVVQKDTKIVVQNDSPPSLYG